LRNIRALFIETACLPVSGWVLVPWSGTVVVVPEPESLPDPL
jgi:hypothetical protein